MTIKEFVSKRKEEIKEYVSGLAIKPFLVIVQVNDDVASNAYVKGKLKDASELGINAELKKLPTSTTEEELLNIINILNRKDNL